MQTTAFLLSLIIGCMATPTVAAERQPPGLRFSNIENRLGPDLIVVRGNFTTTDPTSQFLDAILIDRPQIVVLDSNGGDPHSAMKLGRLIQHLPRSRPRLLTGVISSGSARKRLDWSPMNWKSRRSAGSIPSSMYADLSDVPHQQSRYER